MIRRRSPVYQHMQHRPNQRSNPPDPLIRKITPSHRKRETSARMHRRSTVASCQRCARETNQAQRGPYRERRREHAEELLLAGIERESEGEEAVVGGVVSLWYDFWEWGFWGGVGSQEGKDGENFDEEGLSYGDGTGIAEATTTVISYTAVSAEGSTQHTAGNCGAEELA